MYINTTSDHIRCHACCSNAIVPELSNRTPCDSYYSVNMHSVKLNLYSPNKVNAICHRAWSNQLCQLYYVLYFCSCVNMGYHVRCIGSSLEVWRPNGCEASSPGSLCVAGEPGTFFHVIRLTQLHMGRDRSKDGCTSLPSALFQRLVCGASGLQRVAARSIDSMPSFDVRELQLSSPMQKFTLLPYVSHT